MTSMGAHLPEVGDLLAGKYRLVGRLGRGGMGVVFDAFHELLQRRVALKVLAPEIVGNREVVTRFMNEARAAARVTSDHVVQMLDVGTLKTGLPFMVMERLDGTDLEQMIEQGTILSTESAIGLLAEGICGVAHAHLEGIIHRDLKPSNMFVARRPDRSTVVKVLDFGISKITDATSSGNVTKTSAVLGSPLYMSPEQLLSAKDIDQRTDIWSLGVIAYQLLTKTLPFNGENVVSIFAAIQAAAPVPPSVLNPGIPAALEQIVMRCLQPKREERFSSVFTLAHALAPFGGERSKGVMTSLEAHLSSKGMSFAQVESSPPITEPPPASDHAATIRSTFRSATDAASVNEQHGQNTDIGVASTSGQGAPALRRSSFAVVAGGTLLVLGGAVVGAVALKAVSDRKSAPAPTSTVSTIIPVAAVVEPRPVREEPAPHPAPAVAPSAEPAKGVQDARPAPAAVKRSVVVAAKPPVSTTSAAVQPPAPPPPPPKPEPPGGILKMRPL